MRQWKYIIVIAFLFLVGCHEIPEPYEPSEWVSLQSHGVIDAMVQPIAENVVSQTVNQGDLFKIELNDGTDPYFAEFNGKEYFFSKVDGIYYVLIPVSYHTQIGAMPLKIYTTTASGTEVKEYSIEVTAKVFEEQSLVVSSTMESTRSDGNLNEDAQKVLKSKSETLIYPLWTEPFIQPVEKYRLSTSYGLVRKINGRISGRHSGMDMAAPKGTPVYAVNEGYVRLAETLYVTGETVVIDHGMSLYSGYGHLSHIDVDAGDYVKRGQVIGQVGSTGFSTGPHLHFTFTIGTSFVNPELIFGQALLP